MCLCCASLLVVHSVRRVFASHRAEAWDEPKTLVDREGRVSSHGFRLIQCVMMGPVYKRFNLRRGEDR